MNFGERADMLKLAGEKKDALMKDYPRAQLVNPEDVNAVFLLTAEPEKYFQTL